MYDHRKFPRPFLQKLSGLLGWCLVCFVLAGCGSDKSRKKGTADLPPLGEEGQESPQLKGKSLEESLEYYRKSLLILIRTEGENSQEVADIYEKMGRIYKKMGNPGQSVEYFGKTLTSLQSLYPANHPLIIKTHKAIADNYFELGEHASAIRFYEEFQRVGTPLYGDTHHSILESMEMTGDAYLKLGSHKEALAAYQAWGKGVQKTPAYGKKSPEMARVYHKLGNVYYELGDMPRSDEAKKIAVNIMYPGLQQSSDVMRARFYVGIHSQDLKRNRASLVFPDRAGLDYHTLEFTLPSGQPVRIIPLPLINEFEIQNVELATVSAGKGLLFYLDAASTKRLSQFSTNSRDMSLVLMIDDKPMGIRPLDLRIQNGQLFTLVQLPDEILSKLVFSLKESSAKLAPIAIGG